jgi:hypothetical protein
LNDVISADGTHVLSEQDLIRRFGKSKVKPKHVNALYRIAYALHSETPATEALNQSDLTKGAVETLGIRKIADAYRMAMQPNDLVRTAALTNIIRIPKRHRPPTLAQKLLAAQSHQPRNVKGRLETTGEHPHQALAQTRLPADCQVPQGRMPQLNHTQGRREPAAGAQHKLWGTGWQSMRWHQVTAATLEPKAGATLPGARWHWNK